MKFPKLCVCFSVIIAIAILAISAQFAATRKYAADAGGRQNDVTQQANRQVAEPLYRIEARLDGQSLNGRIVIIYRNRADHALTRIPIDSAGAARFDRTGEWKPIRSSWYKFLGPVTEIELKTPLPLGGAIQIAAGFRGKLAASQGSYRFGSDWYPHVVALTEHGFDREESEVARFEVTLEASTREIIAASGREENVELLPGGFRRVRFRTEPITSFGIAVSPDFNVVEKDAGGMVVREYQLPQYKEWNSKGFASTAQQVISFYREIFGEYPHRSLAILPGAKDASGGQHLAGNMLQVHRVLDPGHVSPGFEKYIIAHEIGHMLWGYETVLDAGRYNHWLGLGLGIYSDRLFMESKTSFGDRFERNLVDQYLSRVKGNWNTVLDLSRPWAELSRERFDANTVVSHGKGFAVIQMLEQVVGPERFLELTRSLQRQYRWSRITPSQFRVEAEAAAGMPLDWFFTDWVENPRVLRAEIESANTLQDGATEVIVRQTGTAHMPIVCEVARENGMCARQIVARQPERQVVRIPGSGPVRLVRLDPDRRLALFDPDHKSYFGRPWIVVRRSGESVFVRNEARKEHELWMAIDESHRRRTVKQRLLPGQEIAVPIPGPRVRIDAWDTSDHLELSCEPDAAAVGK